MSDNADTAEAKLLNSRGRVTRHVFVGIDVRDDALYPMFRCTENGCERVFGYLRLDTTRGCLEAFFGPLDGELRARTVSQALAA